MKVLRPYLSSVSSYPSRDRAVSYNACCYEHAMKSSQHYVVQDLQRRGKIVFMALSVQRSISHTTAEQYETVFRAVSVQRSQCCGHETPSMSGIYQAVHLWHRPVHEQPCCRHVRRHSAREIFQNIHLSCLPTLAPLCEDQRFRSIGTDDL